LREPPKKTPKDATEFEREQLRFFLAKDDAAQTLAQTNPSLAWLPLLAELKLIDTGTQLAPWIERNFAETDAILEVAANIHFFGADTADILEFRLNRTEGLRSLLVKCWRLIIRHMRAGQDRALSGEWFDIEPRIRRREQSPELLERLADVLRPKLKVGRRLFWPDEETHREPQRPTDLLSIDYEIEIGVTAEEVLSVWREDMPIEGDDKLLRLLTHALGAALEDAMEAGVEGNHGYSLSDSDVRSVAKHEQNAHRTGFLPIVRVTADLWTRLARKDTQRALAFVDAWRASPFRLMRRLALFAAADAAVPANLVAELLITLPAGELFLTNSSVEVYRLIDARWRDLTTQEQQAIELRIAEGPPADWFRSDQEQLVDRSRFDLLGHLDRNGFTLHVDARKVLDDIRMRWPNWELRPRDQAGFHIWQHESTAIVGDPEKLSGVDDADLISAARRAGDQAQFLEGDTWQALCRADGPRALRGLAASAAAGQWPVWAWHPFLWAAKDIRDAESVTRIGELLLEWPKDDFSGIAADASWWLNESAQALDDRFLWPLWDRIMEATSQSGGGPAVDDYFTASINDPSGRLAEVLLKKLTKGSEDRELPVSLRARLDKLITAGEAFGRLARVRLAADVSLLFERAPNWTKERIIPLFDWSSPDAAALWSARKYSNYIGSPDLFRLTKQPFLELFTRTDVSEDDVRTFADWLVAIMMANFSKVASYPITSAEARSALREAGTRGLSSVGHRLAIEMERVRSEEKLSKWRDVIGPVFQSIWPLDVELQTSASTFKLVQLLRASGAAFPDAAKIVVPFIRADETHSTSIFSISDADDVLYSSSPERMLDLVVAVVGEARGVYGLRKSLERIREHAPQLADTRKFQKLLALAGPT
jgi:hypothetical protein